MSHRLRYSASLVFFCLPLLRLACGPFPQSFPDNVDLRASLFSSLIGAPKEAALVFGEQQRQSQAGKVLVRVFERSSDFIVEFRNTLAGSSLPGRGSCIIQRSKAKGNYILAAKILLLDSPDCYVKFYPSGSTSKADVVLYGALVAKGLDAGDLLYRILVRPFGLFVDRTRAAFDWNMLSLLPSSDAGKFSDSLTYSLSNPRSQPDSAHFSRSLIVARLLEQAAGFEELKRALAALGESGAVELDHLAQQPLGFTDEGYDFSDKPLTPFPRYEPGRGIQAKALRSFLFLDSRSYPDSLYIVAGAGRSFMALPVANADKRFDLLLFAGGGELSWDSLGLSPAVPLRVLRLSLRSPGSVD